MLARPEELVLDDISRTLLPWCGARIERSASGISVDVSDPRGFDMAIVVEGDRITLAFDEWVEEFFDVDYARHIFGAALDGTARLKVDLLSGKPWRWTLERLDQFGEWVPESTIGHVTWRIWGRSSVVYLRNNFKQPDEFESVDGGANPAHR